MPDHLKGVGYFSSPNWVIECGELLRPREKLVLMYLIRKAGPDGSSFPSIATMAREIGTSSRTVSYGLRDLIKIGIIEREQRRSESGGLTSSLYTFNASWRPPENIARRARRPRKAYNTTYVNQGEEKAQHAVDNANSSLDRPTANIAEPAENTPPRKYCSTAIDAGPTANIAVPTAIVAHEVLPTEVLPTEVHNNNILQDSIPNAFKNLKLFLPGGTCYHTKWTPKFFEQFAEISAEWEKNCPLVKNINLEISKAHMWCVTQGKVRKNLAKFLTNWMNNAQARLEKENAGQQTFIPRGSGARILKVSDELRAGFRERSPTD